MVLNRLGDKKGTNLSNVVRFNEAIKTKTSALGTNSFSCNKACYQGCQQDSVIYTIYVLYPLSFS